MVAKLSRLLLWVVLPVLILDQASKWWIRTHLSPHDEIVLIPHLLAITYASNPGAAFSLLANAPEWVRAWFLIGLSIAAVVVLLVLIAGNPELSLASFALRLILAGAIGNLIDRMWRGQVTDFILMHYYQYNYPVFNVADSAITIGVVLLLVTSLVGSRESKTVPG